MVGARPTPRSRCSATGTTLVSFYYYPAEHWRQLRTSNVVESVFAGVRIRTDVAKRARVRENALYLVFKDRRAPR